MNFVLGISFLLLSIATALALWRLFKGPSSLDRLLAFDAILILLVAKLVVASVRWKTDEFLELILVITSLGFFTTVVFYYYLSRLPIGSPDFTAEKPEDAP
jgi:multisubunit Na+/H+ antiporter MnhF subunit